jgi:integrase
MITEKVEKDNYTIVRTKGSNKVWQFSMWIRKENKAYRQSLRTNHIELAEEKAEMLYYDIRHKVQNNRKVFSPSIKSAIEMYMEYRRNDVGNGYITLGRFNTIATQLKHFSKFAHKDTVLTDLNRKSMKKYHSTRKSQTRNTVANATLLNEQASINALIKWLWKEGYIHFDSFDFERITPETNLDNSRRNNFTDDEYRMIVEEMKQMAFKKNNVIEDDFIWNNMFKNFILILSNTGMRVGEALQLRWRDVGTENITFEGTKYRVATISVRAETSKWRKDRTFRSRNGNQFDRLKRISKYTRRDDFIFQNEEVFCQKNAHNRFRKRFNKILKQLDLYQIPNRKLDMYSLRHFFVTKRVDSGVLLQDLANMIGTSVIQIEKHYYHTNKNKQIETALL